MSGNRLWNIFSKMFMVPPTWAGFSLADKPVARVWGDISLLGASSNTSYIYTLPIKWQWLLLQTPSCTLKKSCLVQCHQMNAKVCSKLEEIKHTGGCWDAGQCSERCIIHALQLGSSLMRVLWLFLDFGCTEGKSLLVTHAEAAEASQHQRGDESHCV